MSLLAATLALTIGAFPEAVAPRDRTEVAVVLVTLDSLRRGQEAYGRGRLERLGDPSWGMFRLARASVQPDRFESCLDDRMGAGLDYCIRFYLTRAEAPAGPPVVVVVLDDDPETAPRHIDGQTMRVTCFGRGVVPADAGLQDTWLWPGAARMHGVRDLDRDDDALAACITAAASERWTGLRQPDRN
ncbi:hypothetical protein GCM10009422_05530 [Brevundimonas kwangchunensis]|uniref:Uncharacterized protein n=1 Tax=Brevundimonas kwangchunensis TaxID=322163 RepID=A0ABN1GKK7_9CAUL